MSEAQFKRQGNLSEQIQTYVSELRSGINSMTYGRRDLLSAKAELKKVGKTKNTSFKNMLKRHIAISKRKHTTGKRQAERSIKSIRKVLTAYTKYISVVGKKR